MANRRSSCSRTTSRTQLAWRVPLLRMVDSPVELGQATLVSGWLTSPTRADSAASRERCRAVCAPGTRPFGRAVTQKRTLWAALAAACKIGTRPSNADCVLFTEERAVCVGGKGVLRWSREWAIRRPKAARDVVAVWAMGRWDGQCVWWQGSGTGRE